MSKYYIARQEKNELYRMVGPYDTYADAAKDVEDDSMRIVKACVEENQYGAPVGAYPWPNKDSYIDEEESE